MTIYKAFLYILSFFLLILAGLMAVPAMLAATTHSNGGREFLYPCAGTLAIGLLLYKTCRVEQLVLLPRQMFLLTVVVWAGVSCAAALPLMLASHIGITDAFFETMSGITTTGSTVLTGLQEQPPAVLLWRSLLQWMGGIGFIVMGVAVLPFLQIGGMRLFQTESSDWSEKAMPRARQVATGIAQVYVLLTLSCTMLYWVFGMSPFDAVNHAMTTVSTGGYSTSDASFSQFQQPALHVVAIIYMLLGSLPFMLYVRFRRGDQMALLRDQQVRGFLVFLAAATAVMTAWLVLERSIPLREASLLAGFNVVSVVTTTGFASTDYAQWGSMPLVAFFYLTFIGGCSGSTAGGMKIFRFQLAMRMLHNQLVELAYPNRVLSSSYNNRPVSDDIMRSVVTFSFAFFASIAVLATFLSTQGLDSVTALTGAATALTNVGPGLGDVIGPAGNFSSLPDAAKWALSLGMLMGRLEVMTLLVLLTGAFWRH